MYKKILSLILLFGLLTACNPDDAEEEISPSTTPAAQGVITLADISNEPADKIREMQPLADMLAANLSEFGIGRAEVKVAPDLETILNWLKTGEIDLYFDTAYGIMIAMDEAGGQPILRHWKDEQPEYHTVIFAVKDSAITSIEDLKGKVIAFEDPSSTSSYMLPMAYLIQQGLTMVEVSDPSDPVGEDEVGYFFTYDDENTLQRVLNGSVAAGALHNIYYNSFMDEATRAEMTILAETEPITRRMVLAASDLDPALVEAIKQTLIDMDETEEGKAALTTFDDTLQFDDFPEGIDTALARMRELYEIVQNR